eukprot:94250-Karenia_brevis.AAC.1
MAWWDVGRAAQGKAFCKACSISAPASSEDSDIAIAIRFRSLFGVAKLEKLALGVVFLDLQTAFASMLRQIVFVPHEGDEQFLHKLTTVGVHDTDIKAIYDALRISMFPESCNQAVVALVAEYHQLTWATTEGLQNCLHTLSGTIAGTPLADLVFIFAMVRILLKLRSELEKRELVHT